VLEEFMDVPTHPLIIHFPVVLVPLLALLAIAYALVPLVRPHTRWILGLLAIAAPIATLLAKLSGDAFFDRMIERDEITPEFFPRIEEHQDLGTNALYASIVLGVLTLALVYFVRPRARVAVGAAVGGTAEPGAAEARPAAAGSNRVLSLVLTVLVVVAAGVSLYYVIRTGDTGAKNVWEGR
jgi:hypothetical protein